LLNLVSNSAKFTTHGFIRISVYLQGSDTAGNPMIRIDVEDTGIGIASKDLPKLFEAFQQVDSSLTRTVGGTGLGLPIAKSLVELQGGEMIVESTVGVGSIFSVTVPTTPSGAEDDETLDSLGEGDDTMTKGITISEIQNSMNGESNESPMPVVNKVSGPPPGMFQQKRQILLIEDDPNIVDMFRRTLQPEGFDMIAATVPLEATAMASGLRPTLIVMDVNFADEAGWNILSQIKDRDDTFDIPVIVVTLSDETERAYQLGAYAVIQRPFIPAGLIDTVLMAEEDSNIDRILIIDDQPDSTRLLQELLQEHGHYRVFAAHTGPEGISLVARRQPDLIILDLRMPDMDGFAVLNELRTRPETASIPVVVVTSDTSLNDVEKEQLINLEIIYKTDLNQNNYEQFIDEVRKQITGYNGS
jgi:CheY-like chemotaxis protein